MHGPPTPSVYFLNQSDKFLIGSAGIICESGILGRVEFIDVSFLGCIDIMFLPLWQNHFPSTDPNLF